MRTLDDSYGNATRWIELHSEWSRRMRRRYPVRASRTTTEGNITSSPESVTPFGVALDDRPRSDPDGAMIRHEPPNHEVRAVVGFARSDPAGHLRNPPEGRVEGLEGTYNEQPFTSNHFGPL